MKKLISFLLFTSTVIISYAQSNYYAEATAWLNKNAIPIKTVKAENGLEDLKPLDNLIGDARIVELGECTHGSSEIFSMKHRMLEYLVKEKGFTIFSIEANMPEAYALNQYIIEGKGDSRKLLSGMYFWTWNTQEVLDMIEWMKRYNETATKKIMFTGFDMQISSTSVKIIRNFANTHQTSLLSVIDEYDTLSRISATQIRKGKAANNSKALKELANNMIDSLQHSTSLAKDTAFEWALQNAKILLQYSQFLNGGPDRDECMAVNIQWILQQNPAAKMVIWAHNAHISKAPDKFGTIRMGNYLAKTFGNKMIAIGFATEQGTYTAVNKETKSVDSANVLLLSKEGSCEYILKTAEADNFLIDLRNSAMADKATSWMFEKPLIRHIGAIANDKYQFMNTDLNKDYDMLIFLRKTNASKCFVINYKKE